MAWAHVMCLADLEYDYINPYESTSRINRVILPEFVTQGALCLFYLVTGHWFMFLLCLPYLYYDVRMLLYSALEDDDPSFSLVL